MSEIKNKQGIQEIQDYLAKLSNLSLCLISLQGKPLTLWSNSSLLCHYMKENFRGKCKKEHSQIHKKVLVSKEACIFTCYLGISGFCIPLIKNQKVVAFLYGGVFYISDTYMKSSDYKFKELSILNEDKLNEIISFFSNFAYFLDLDKLFVSQVQKPRVNISFFEKGLTKREAEILSLIVENLTNKEISSKLSISPNTLKVHLSRIYKKFEVSKKTDLLLSLKNIGYVSEE